MPVLGEGHDLDVHKVPDLLPQLQEGLQGGELGVVDVHVGADVLDAVGGLETDGPVDPFLYLPLGEGGLVLLPTLDALEQGARQVPAGAAGGEAGIQMDVGLHKGGQGQLAGTVGYHLLPRAGGEIRADLLELPVGHPDVRRLGGVVHIQLLKQHRAHLLSRSSGGPTPNGAGTPDIMFISLSCPAAHPGRSTGQPLPWRSPPRCPRAAGWPPRPPPRYRRC